MAEINEVKLNGQTILSTRSNTVTEDTLVQGETAQNKAGVSIVGRLDPVDKDKAYLISDEIGEIDNADYMPFYDTSEQKKKKTLFGSIVEKLKSVFAQKTDLKAHTFEVGTEIPENADLNNYTTAGVYTITPDAKARTISNIPYAKDIIFGGKLIVLEGLSSGNAYKQQIYLDHENHLFKRRTTGSEWTSWDRLGSAFEEMNFKYATEISNIDLDDLKDFGFYAWSMSNASTISNRPTSGNESGLLYVFASWNNNNHRRQILFMRDSDTYYSRITTDGSSWSDWKQLASTDDIAPSTVGNGYAVGTVSGSAITATISGFKLRAGVIVAIRLGSGLPANCTLNISNTGVKDIYYWGDNAIREMDVFNGSSIYTFMYDGTRYRLLSWSLVPTIFDQNYVADTSGNIGLTVGYNVNAFQIKNSIDSKKLVWNYYKNSAWRGDVKIADYDDLGASVAKVGKNILPSWSFSTNVLVNNGITYTFNPTTGEITANGTATAISTCIIAGTSTPYYYYIPKGEYILTGCPSGGSASTYYISVQYSYIDSPSTMSSILDTGSGATVTLEKDIYCNASKNHHYYIFVASGQTVSNLVFKPMLRPAFTTADYEPCEDIHKGNCYVGTCTTAGATKDKVAYVDGYFVLRKGVRVAIKFSNTNTYSSTTASPITLNVNDTGAKNIWYNSTHSGAGNTGAYTTIYGVANLYYYFVYDGTYWVWDGRTGDNDTTDPRVLGFGYGTCATAEATTAKVVTLSNYTLRNGGYVSVKFTYGVPANSTMNINSKGAKNIWYRGANITANVIKAGDLATFIYDGSYYQLVGVDRNPQKYVLSNTSGIVSGYTAGTDVSITQMFVSIDGDIVTVAFGFKFTSAKTLTTNTVIISGFPTPSNYAFTTASNNNTNASTGGATKFYQLYLNPSGVLYTRAGAYTANETIWVGFTYIKA